MRTHTSRFSAVTAIIFGMALSGCATTGSSSKVETSTAAFTEAQKDLESAAAEAKAIEQASAEKRMASAQTRLKAAEAEVASVCKEWPELELCTPEHKLSWATKLMEGACEEAPEMKDCPANQRMLVYVGTLDNSNAVTIDSTGKPDAWALSIQSKDPGKNFVALQFKAEDDTIVDQVSRVTEATPGVPGCFEFRKGVKPKRIGNTCAAAPSK